MSVRFLQFSAASAASGTRWQISAMPDLGRAKMPGASVALQNNERRARAGYRMNALPGGRSGMARTRPVTFGSRGFSPAVLEQSRRTPPFYPVNRTGAA
jgi:hypothetical protein